MSDDMQSQSGVSWRKVETPHADAWVAWDGQEGTDYSYGGTRLVPFDVSDEDAVQILARLAIDESQLKNKLINLAVEEGILEPFESRLPAGFIAARVGGGRCVMRPRTEQDAEILADPAHPKFSGTIEPVFEGIGQLLNSLDGRVKLTPDFGRFAGLADVLYRYTPHVLGVGRGVGGCGGKSSYSTTGVIAAFEQVKPDFAGPLTLLGSLGAMGGEFFDYLRNARFQDVAVGDIAYPEGTETIDGYPVVATEFGTYTAETLLRGGAIVTNTWGNELTNVDLDHLRPGTKLLLAHNHSVPGGPAGLELMRAVADRDVLALPGQVLTLGGALTSRIEWFSRQADSGQLFDKPLAHDVVRAVVRYWVSRCVDSAGQNRLTPYEVMLQSVD
ncbi:hypothetical protein [Nocardia sp. CNY236]|uniref:hypothetical protein n=1 Tax=Nocardia sp. CNY236 TaxID=1169152 RepID=UPI0012DF6D71|nr:hypothetical protein [Nocardia sp. CNY236]